MRQQRDADAQLPDLGNSSNNLTANAALMQREGQAQAAYAAANDCYLYFSPVDCFNFMYQIDQKPLPGGRKTLLIK